MYKTTLIILLLICNYLSAQNTTTNFIVEYSEGLDTTFSDIKQEKLKVIWTLGAYIIIENDITHYIKSSKTSIKTNDDYCIYYTTIDLTDLIVCFKNHELSQITKTIKSNHGKTFKYHYHIELSSSLVMASLLNEYKNVMMSLRESKRKWNQYLDSIKIENNKKLLLEQQKCLNDSTCCHSLDNAIYTICPFPPISLQGDIGIYLRNKLDSLHKPLLDTVKYAGKMRLVYAPSDYKRVNFEFTINEKGLVSNLIFEELGLQYAGDIKEIILGTKWLPAMRNPEDTPNEGVNSAKIIVCYKMKYSTLIQQFKVKYILD